MEKTRASSAVATRKIISGEHLNPNGTLFGGYLMCWMDEVAFMCARRFTGQPTCVTINIDNVTFRNPLRLGEQIVLTAVINHVGNSSMEIQVNVDREDPETHQLTHTNSAHLTFVCLNKELKPIRVPRLILESEEDRQKNKESCLRMRIRRRLIAFLSKRRIGDAALNLNPPSQRKIDQLLANFNQFAERIGIAIPFPRNSILDQLFYRS